MTISLELFSAILSMDAYNRGYNAGLNDNGENDPDGLGESGRIGNAAILTRIDTGISDGQYQAWQDAGFYSIAYEITDNSIEGLANGQKVISYRGTDGELPWNLSKSSSPICRFGRGTMMNRSSECLATT